MNEYILQSSSRNSSSSVRNPYGYRSNSNKQVKNTSSDFDYEFGGVKCKCDLPAPCQEAWKEGTLDPGRRFFGCSRFKDPKRRCNFFLWADPTYPERARDVIRELKFKLKMKDEELQSAKSEINFVERKMLVLNEEVDALRTKMKEASTMLKKKRM
ncbi:GRF-type domain-containing protein [Heracleum sosnowskyi]|uniref:GRF-type domain-containing protein n=1 Tax=Heracleum sosnowskyi TaxID=360622 RepID=A0AAD8M7H4_9APIA|nr:GRF-type domain-containing protein [Heracleum sosnowskyi]